VLDVGCGHGEVAIPIASNRRSILAYDRVERYIHIAQTTVNNLGLSNLVFRCSDSSSEKNAGRVHILAKDNSFDLIISRRVHLHWLKDTRRVPKWILT
jgi:2-polyprenyl-3-methyl-5-hydroxy-6-metoxy-1,4-benzoquinol methylase